MTTGAQEKIPGKFFDYGSHVYNVMHLDFGAVGDGLVDDTSAIQAAINLAATAGGGTVLIPEGTFIASQIKLKTKVILAGVGWGSILKQKSGTSGSFIILNDVNVEFTCVRDLQIDGNKAGQAAANHGVYLDNTGGSWTQNDQHHLLENLFIRNCKGSGISKDTDVREARIINCYLLQNDRYGIETEASGGTDNWHIGCTAEKNGLSGFRCNGFNDFWGFCKAFGNGQNATPGYMNGFDIEATGLTITNCWAQENPDHGFKFDEPVSFNCKGVVGSELVADSNGDTGFYFDYAYECFLMSCHAKNSSGLLYAHDWAVAVTANSESNVIQCSTKTAVVFTVGTFDDSALGSNKIENHRRYGSYENVGAGVATGDEHFVFGQVGYPDTNSPKYTIKSEVVGTATEVRFEGYDGATTKEFCGFDWDYTVFRLGSASVYPRLPVRTDANRGAAGVSGRIIFNSDDGALNIDTGSDWTLADGTVT